MGIGAGARESASGASAYELGGIDVLWVLLSYAVCMAVRSCVVLVLFPGLRRLGYGMSGKEAIVTAWGGLHGSVGLALVMSMQSRLTANGEAQKAQQLLLHVSGVTLLTLIVNAPTLAPILR